MNQSRISLAIKRQLRVSVCISIIFFSLPTVLFAQKSAAPKLPADANQLVREVIDNELKVSNQDHTHWMYQQQSRDGDKTTVKEIVETKDCDLDFTISINGKPLTAEERQKEDERLRKLATDPDEQQKKMKAAQQDADKATDMFKMLPEAFLYQYSSKTHSLVKLTFKPNPDFHPPTREAQVFHAMEGTMWVNTREMRLGELDGQLSQDVQFLGGLIGHLDKGGRFSVKRTELEPGHWETTQLNVNMNGKVIIFKSINLQQSDSMSHFRRLPRDLSAVQAAEMLKKEGFAGTRNELATNGAHTRVGD
jgi:hypothetical protein